MKKLLFFSGAKGGTGKTTLALNTAVLLAYHWRDATQYPVVYLDLTPSLGTGALLLLGDIMGQWGRPSLSDFLAGHLAEPLRAFYLRRWTTDKGPFQLVFAYMARDAPLTKRHLSLILDTVERRLRPRLVVIDMPPVASGESPVAGAVDYVVPVVTPDASAIETTKAFAEVIGAPRLRPVLNMFIPDYPVSAVHAAPWVKVVQDAFGEEPHVIPYDKLLQAARQALEIEVLKLKPAESPGVKAIIEYARYLSTRLA